MSKYKPLCSCNGICLRAKEWKSHSPPPLLNTHYNQPEAHVNWNNMLKANTAIWGSCTADTHVLRCTFVVLVLRLDENWEPWQEGALQKDTPYNGDVTEMSTTSNVNKICQIISTALGTCGKLPGRLLRLYALSESYIICRKSGHWLQPYIHIYIIQGTNVVIVVLTPCHIEFTQNNKVFSFYRIILIVTLSRQKIQTKIINKIT